MTEREKIIRFFADVHKIECPTEELESRFTIVPVDYGNQGWLQVHHDGKPIGELFGNHPRIFFHP